MAVSVAVHAHPVAAVTATVPVLAANGTFTEGAAIVGAQGAPACVTVKVFAADRHRCHSRGRGRIGRHGVADRTITVPEAPGGDRDPCLIADSRPTASGGVR